MASGNPFNFHSGLWLLLSRIILSQNALNSEMMAMKVSDLDNHLEKIYFADLVKDAKSAAGFSPYR